MEVRQVQQDLQDTKRGTTMDFFVCVPVSFWKAVQSSEKKPFSKSFEDNEELW